MVGFSSTLKGALLIPAISKLKICESAGISRKKSSPWAFCPLAQETGASRTRLLLGAAVLAGAWLGPRL